MYRGLGSKKILFTPSNEHKFLGRRLVSWNIGAFSSNGSLSTSIWSLKNSNAKLNLVRIPYPLHINLVRIPYPLHMNLAWSHTRSKVITWAQQGLSISHISFIYIEPCYTYIF